MPRFAMGKEKLLASLFWSEEQLSSIEAVLNIPGGEIAVVMAECWVYD